MSAFIGIFLILCMIVCAAGVYFYDYAKEEEKRHEELRRYPLVK